MTPLEDSVAWMALNAEETGETVTCFDASDRAVAGSGREGVVGEVESDGPGSAASREGGFTAEVVDPPVACQPGLDDSRSPSIPDWIAFSITEGLAVLEEGAERNSLGVEDGASWSAGPSSPARILSSEMVMGAEFGNDSGLLGLDPAGFRVVPGRRRKNEKIDRLP